MVSGKDGGIDQQPIVPFASVAGKVLREIRQGRSLSLRQVTIRSQGRFKPSSVASYERGERQLSLERLFELARVYDVEPHRVVAAIGLRLERREPSARVVPLDDLDVADVAAQG